MAGSILVRDVLFRVSKDLGDINPQFTRWTQKELVHALNDGQRAIAKFLPHSCARIDSIKLAAGTKQSIAQISSGSIIPGDGSTPVAVRGNVLQSVIRNMGSNGLTPGYALSIVDQDTLNACNPGWHLPTKTGKKPSEYTYDPRTPQTFYVNPGVPLGDSVWVEVSMQADPAEIPNAGTEDYGQGSVGSKTITVDDKYADDLHHYILARAHMKDAESQASAELAGINSSMFTSSINAQAEAMTGVNPNLQSLPMNSGFAASSR